jgi:hypothetical protein
LDDPRDRRPGEQDAQPSMVRQAVDNFAHSAADGGSTMALEVLVDGACTAGKVCFEGVANVVCGVLEGL